MSSREFSFRKTQKLEINFQSPLIALRIHTLSLMPANSIHEKKLFVGRKQQRALRHMRSYRLILAATAELYNTICLCQN